MSDLIKRPTVTVDRDGDQVTMQIVGDIERETVEKLRADIDAATAEAGTVVVDLAGVEFCDVGGVRMFATLIVEAAQRGVPVRLCAAHDTLRWLFATMECADLLEPER